MKTLFAGLLLLAATAANATVADVVKDFGALGSFGTTCHKGGSFFDSTVLNDGSVQVHIRASDGQELYFDIVEAHRQGDDYLYTTAENVRQSKYLLVLKKEADGTFHSDSVGSLSGSRFFVKDGIRLSDGEPTARYQPCFHTN